MHKSLHQVKFWLVMFSQCTITESRDPLTSHGLSNSLTHLHVTSRRWRHCKHWGRNFAAYGRRRSLIARCSWQSSSSPARRRQRCPYFGAARPPPPSTTSSPNAWRHFRSARSASAVRAFPVPLCVPVGRRVERQIGRWRAHACTCRPTHDADALVVWWRHRSVTSSTGSAAEPRRCEIVANLKTCWWLQS